MTDDKDDFCQRSLWGWGWSEAPAQVGVLVDFALERVRSQFNVTLDALAPEPQLDDVVLAPPRLALSDSVPERLRAVLTSSKEERAKHTFGKAFVDIVRALKGDFRHAPDYVALPQTDADVALLLDFASQHNIAVVPYGGGTSVVRGIEPVGLVDGHTDDDDDEEKTPPHRRYAAVITCDMRRMCRLVEVNVNDRTAVLEAGMTGPQAEAALKPYGLSTRHYAQAFEFSTVGGWVVTRGQGHLASMYVHIDELVESLTVVTPRGRLTTPRFPGFGSGPDGNRLFAGSEGALGVVTRVALKLHERPACRVACSAAFADYWHGVAAARAVAQSGVYPQNCRLVDAAEALATAVGDGTCSYLLLQIEGQCPAAAVAAMRHLLDLCRRHGGHVVDADAVQAQTLDARAPTRTPSGDAAADAWRHAFVLSPYVRNELTRRYVISETFETACSWSQFPRLHRDVCAAVTAAVARVCGPGRGSITCRFTAVYPSGPAPYFTVLAVGEPSLDAMLRQWAAIKQAASDALLAAGGCITHHHAVGRYHRRHYAREADPVYLQLLANVKSFLDPHGILNPGVLLDVPPPLSRL